ncbi:MAG: zinc ABC transporter substrate-binding protein [Anaerolineae bacterium]|nr:zinc ABC transporter substrate-binding protein [Anaerolineae bacterium]
MRWLFLILTLLLAAGCQANADSGEDGLALLALPELQPGDVAAGERLRVVATTSVIGDVVGRVGGEAIELVTIIGAGQEPHSYQPAPSDLIGVTAVDVIFVNGWQLEEGLLRDIEKAAEDVPLVPISAGITPLPAGAHEEEDGDEEEYTDGVADPHVWMDPHLVRQWVANARDVLATLDPARAGTYEENAAAYLAELEELIAYSEEQLGTLPASRRRLVTNHEALAYFAAAFDFEIIGTVIPSASTVSEPSARALTTLVERMEVAGVCTIFTDNAANPALAEATAAELRSCEDVAVLPLYTGSLGAPGSGAESYVGMMRMNVDTIVGGLSP